MIVFHTKFSYTLAQFSIITTIFVVYKNIPLLPGVVLMLVLYISLVCAFLGCELGDLMSIYNCNYWLL